VVRWCDVLDEVSQQKMNGVDEIEKRSDHVM